MSLGTWTYLFQGLLVLILMFLQKRFVPQYLFSFVVGFLFGQLVDVHELWIHILPQTLPCRILYFIISYLLLSVGIALSNRCGLPIVPTDLFPREVSQISGIHYPRIKISFDVLCLVATACMTKLFLGHFGRSRNRNCFSCTYHWKMVGIIGSWLDKHLVNAP